MKSLTNIILYFGVFSVVFVLLGILIKSHFFPLKGKNPFYLKDSSENLRYFIFALVIFECSGQYFVNHFGLDLLQGKITLSVSVVIISLVLTLVSFLGMVIFGLLCSVPTPNWFKTQEQDIWSDYDDQ